MKKQILLLLTYLPNWFNFFILRLNIPFSYLFGKKYENYKNKILNDKFENDSLLQNVLVNAIEYVPFYKKLNIHEPSIDSFPIIDKNIVMKNFESFISDDIVMLQYDKVTTGGTSGKPMTIIVPKNRFITEWGTLHSMWYKAIDFNNDIRGVIRNHKLHQHKNIHTINPITKEVIFDGFRVDEEYMHYIYETIEKYKLKYLHCYPSAGYLFAKYLVSKNLSLNYLHAMITSSENIYDEQIKFIEENLKIRFYNFYGHSEKLAIGGFCKYNNFIHIEPSYGYVELIDENGKNITEVGQIGEIVATTLNNFGMPLIRYKTGDFAEYYAGKCPDCRHEGMILKKIYGRWNGEKVYKVDGSYVTTTALNLHDHLYEVIDGLQYYQDKIGELEVRIIKSKQFLIEHEKELYKHFKSVLNTKCNVKIVYLKELEKHSNGKFLLLISKVDK